MAPGEKRWMSSVLRTETVPHKVEKTGERGGRQTSWWQFTERPSCSGPGLDQGGTVVLPDTQRVRDWGQDCYSQKGEAGVQAGPPSLEEPGYLSGDQPGAQPQKNKPGQQRIGKDPLLPAGQRSHQADLLKCLSFWPRLIRSW